MAKLTNIPRGKRGPSVRGSHMVDTFRGTIRVRKWPKKRGPPKSDAQKFWVDWFKQANFLAKYASDMDVKEAMEITAGTGLYPRDVILQAMRGRLYWWVDENGWRWYPVAAINDVSETLDVLAQTIGSVLVRDTDRWRAPPAGTIGDVLTYKGILLPPVWQTPGGGGLSFSGAMAGTNIAQSIPNATQTAAKYELEDYDTDALHDNVTNNTRMTVPTGWTKVRLFGGTHWASNGTGSRILEFWKNGATFRGGSRVRARAIGGSAHALASPAVPVVAGDYFELMVWQNRGSALNLSGLTTFNYFAMERAE